MKLRYFVLGFLFSVAAVTGLGIYELLRGPRSWFFGFDRGMQRRYERIQLGCSKADAIRVLGEPYAAGERLNMPWTKEHEERFNPPGRPRVDYYLWSSGGNWYYCVGFLRASGKAIFKAEGGS